MTTPDWLVPLLNSIGGSRVSANADTIVKSLKQAGYRIERIPDPAEAPPWAEVLLNSLFTGARLDFGGEVIPNWLRRRLEAEYGMPVPTGEQAQRPATPLDLDEERPTDAEVARVLGHEGGK